MKTQYVLEGYVTLDPFLVEWFGVSKAPQVRKTKRKEEEGDQETRQGIPEIKQSSLHHFKKLSRAGLPPSPYEAKILREEARRNKQRSTMYQTSYGTSPVRSNKVQRDLRN